MLIRYYGHVGVPTGYGDAAAETCMAILAAGFDLEISTDGRQCPSRFLPLARCIRDEAALSKPDVCIVHTLPVDCAAVLRRSGLEGTDVLTVACTTWEGWSGAAIPREVADSLRRFDAIWVPSGATRHAVVRHENIAGSGVFVVPYPADLSSLPEAPCGRCHAYHVATPFLTGQRVRTPSGLSTQVTSCGGGMVWVSEEGKPQTFWFWPCELRVDFGLDLYRFYYIGAWTARKNVQGLVHAYMRAFEPTDPVELVIHAPGASETACAMAQMSSGLPPGAWPSIRFSRTRISQDEIDRLHAECHCFVTATRGEAWNLPAFHAMVAGRNIITPRSLGSGEFLRGTSAAFYGARPAPAFGDAWIVPGHPALQYAGAQGLNVRSYWLDPDLAELAHHMRDAFEERTTHLTLDTHIAARFSREAVGATIRRILDLLTTKEPRT